MEKINILIYEPYPFESEGGNQKTLSYILKFTNKEEFNLTIVVPFYTNFVKKLKNQGIDCIIVETPQRLSRYGGKSLRENIIKKFLTFIDVISYNFKFRIYLKRKNIDVIYCNCIRAVLLVGFSALINRTPLLWYIKGELKNRVLDTMGFYLAEKILFFCEANKNDKYKILLKLFKRKIDILKIGIDLNSILKIEKIERRALSEEFSIKCENTNLIFLGQLYPQKGIHFLIQALAIVVKKFPNTMLYIVGDHVIEEYKPYRKELFKIINGNNLSNNIVFTGWRPDALEILSLMDVLVHPSLSEGFGRAVLEGMALGKPVIASKVGGLRELIKSGENGFLVEPGNVNKIANNLIYLIENENLRDKLGLEGRKTVFSEYMIQDKIKHLENIWKKMVFPDFILKFKHHESSLSEN